MGTAGVAATKLGALGAISVDPAPGACSRDMVALQPRRNAAPARHRAADDL